MALIATLGWGDLYDIEEWRLWCAWHDFVIEDVRECDVHSDGRVTVYRYASTPDGRRFVDPDSPVHAMMLDPVTITPDMPPPPFTDLGGGFGRIKVRDGG